jgi:hypothetical protein
MNNKLVYLEEPKLVFGHSQAIEDPRDGLTLFGPFEKVAKDTIQAGVIGTSDGIKLYKQFVSTIQKPLLSKKIQRPSFPGFEAVFGIVWPESPTLSRTIDSTALHSYLSMKNLKQRTYNIVSMFVSAIKDAQEKEEAKIDIWYVVVPKKVWLQCRPKSYDRMLTKKQLENLKAFNEGQGVLLQELELEFQLMNQYLDSSSDFHNQLKARLLKERIFIPIQLMLEPTLEFKDKYNGWNFKDEMKSHLAWTQSSSTYYKLGRLPWKLSDVRKGVCYVGLVFKQFQGVGKQGFSCSAAQMFLDSGDGTIFKGNVGPWLGEDDQYHLDRESAKELLAKALSTYQDYRKEYPKEVFIHGRASFAGNEWAGFEDAVREADINIRLAGITIRESGKIKLFRDVQDEDCHYGNLRGLTLIIDERESFLWTRGFIPRLNTSSSLEIPNSLRIHIDKGEADIVQVTKDVLALTKLNYNACLYGDGIPVTLRFSDLVGSILTAIDDIGSEVLPFKFYI